MEENAKISFVGLIYMWITIILAQSSRFGPPPVRRRATCGATISNVPYCCHAVLPPAHRAASLAAAMDDDGDGSSSPTDDSAAAGLLPLFSRSPVCPSIDMIDRSLRVVVNGWFGLLVVNSNMCDVIARGCGGWGVCTGRGSWGEAEAGDGGERAADASARRHSGRSPRPPARALGAVAVAAAAFRHSKGAERVHQLRGEGGRRTGGRRRRRVDGMSVDTAAADRGATAQGQDGPRARRRRRRHRRQQHGKTRSNTLNALPWRSISSMIWTESFPLPGIARRRPWRMGTNGGSTGRRWRVTTPTLELTSAAHSRRLAPSRRRYRSKRNEHNRKWLHFFE